jgi:hypothetical protein
LTRNSTVITWTIGYFFLISLTLSCNPTKQIVDKSKFAGHWLAADPETTSSIILDSNGHFLQLLEDSTTSDTLHFTYRLRGNVMTIFVNQHLWASKNQILKLSSDSLVYRRKGDKEVFRYSRKILEK